MAMAYNNKLALRGVIFQASYDEGIVRKFWNEYEKKNGHLYEHRDLTYSIMKDPEAVAVIQRLGSKNDMGGPIGIAWVPEELIEFVEHVEDRCGGNYVVLKEDLVVHRLIKLHYSGTPLDTKERVMAAEDLIRLLARIKACEIQYEFYRFA
jgi:hypothetical protein